MHLLESQTWMIALSHCERSLNPELVQENIIRQLEWHALQAKQSKWDVFFKSDRLNIMETSVVLLFLNVTTPTVTAVYWNRDAICEHSNKLEFSYHFSFIATSLCHLWKFSGAVVHNIFCRNDERASERIFLHLCVGWHVFHRVCNTIFHHKR